MRQTLTYGQVPSFEEFVGAYAAMIDQEPEAFEEGYYVITMLEHLTDHLNLEAAGLLAQYMPSPVAMPEVATGPARFTAWEYRGARIAVTYNISQLYRLVQNLTELHKIDSDEDFAEWAGDFASGILSTLGIEWV